MTDTPIPERNMTHVETNVAVSEIGVYWFRWRAEREKKRRAPEPLNVNGVDMGATYHLRVIETRKPFRWAIYAYQNKLYPNEELPECTCNTDCGCLCPRHDSA